MQQSPCRCHPSGEFFHDAFFNYMEFYSKCWMESGIRCTVGFESWKWYCMQIYSHTYTLIREVPFDDGILVFWGSVKLANICEVTYLWIIQLFTAKIWMNGFGWAVHQFGVFVLNLPFPLFITCYKRT